MAKIEIRLAVGSELAEIVSVFHRSFLPMVVEYHPDIDDSGFTIDEFSIIWEKYFNTEGAQVFVALDGRNESREVVGVMSLIPTQDSGVVELAKLFILPDIQSSGIGRQMMKVAVNSASELGYSNMELWTWAVSYQSIGFYESLGFEDTGECSKSGYKGVEPDRDVTIKYSLKLNSN